MDDERTLQKWIWILGLFYGGEILICLTVNYSTYFNALSWKFLTELSLAALSIFFLVLVWKSLRYVLLWKNFSLAKAAVYSMAAIISGIAVNLLVKWLNVKLFHSEVHFYSFFAYLRYPWLGMLLMIVLLPALFEEIAYRGIILESLLHLTDRRRAIMMAALMFAIIHMSFISLFWLVPFAIWLGNVRTREGTIWYGVLIHFFFNLTGCLMELL